jgi:hypothetical protein
VSRGLDRREPAPTIVKARLAGRSMLRTPIAIPASEAR